MFPECDFPSIDQWRGTRAHWVSQESVKIKFDWENMKTTGVEASFKAGRLGSTGTDLSVKFEEISANNFLLLKQVVR